MYKYIEKIPLNIKSEFISKLERICKNLGIRNPQDLISVMNFESGLNPKIQNSINGATGLIQFIRSTAIRLGTSLEALRTMNVVQQLDYVEKYLSPFKDRLNSAYDIYGAIFFPISIGKPDNWIFEANGLSAGLVAKDNPSIAKYSTLSNAIDIRAFKKYVDNTVLKGLSRLKINSDTSLLLPIIAVAGVGLIAYYFIRKQ